MTTTPPSESALDYLVVVGSSAGGVEALSVLVGALPADFPAPVVIAQHLDPAHASRLAEILGRRSTLPVRSIEVSQSLLPGTVYVVPSNRHVEVTDHMVNLHEGGAVRPAPSVDLLLTSAAQVFGERLIAVILTGSGSDGAAGAHAVKEAGGTVIIQDPATAAFPSMPRALAAPLVDAILPLERIGAFLGDLVTPPASPDATADADLATLLTRVRERRGIDFAAYKPPTIERRLRRRMALVGAATIGAYLAHLESDPAEEERLVADFLIKVTRFFRDPALFERLRTQVLPELAAAAAATSRELRLWSAGCATGEEAYSLAIIVAEILLDHPNPPPVRIFATDLDETALTFARRGVYPSAALADVPREVVSRHFDERNGVSEARKSLRNLIVFGSHDLAERAPFPHTDLVLCRNVLIYFTAQLQQRALELFAYSLRDGGYLVLGKSETPRPVEQAFVAVDRRLRLYQRVGERVLLPPPRLPTFATAAKRPVPPSRDRALRPTSAPGPDQPTGGRAEDLIRRLPIGVAVVDRRYDVETINGLARELLGVHGLAIGQDLIHLAQRIPSTPLRSAIDAVVQGAESWRLANVLTAETATGERRHLALTCWPDRLGADGTVATVLVLVEDVTVVTAALTAAGEAEERTERLAIANRQLLTANRELTDALDRLREQGDDLRLATASAQVSAEEIETLNEELQSTNEELETLHEEAQATVEELNVANDELQARAGELEEMAETQATERARLAAVLAGMADAVVVVDHLGRAVLTNAAYDVLVGAPDDRFVAADEHGVPLAPAATLLARAAGGEIFRLEFTTVKAGMRRSFEANGRPLDEGDVGVGVVVIRDTTDRSVRRLQEEFLSWAGHELRTPLTALQSFLQLAARRIGPDGDARTRELVGRAVTQARRQGALIGELLDASRLESGQLSLRRLPIDLVVLASDAVAVAQVLAKSQTIALEGEEEAIGVDGDPGRLEQVLLNLLTNAITYAPETERIDVSVRRDGAEAVLAVRDFGPGIPPDRLATIFDRFVRGDSGDHAGSGGLGLGLGLYIAQEIIRAHGGTIAVDSALGAGTTFTMRLPMRAGDGAALIDAAVSAASAGSGDV